MYRLLLINYYEDHGYVVGLDSIVSTYDEMSKSRSHVSTATHRVHHRHHYL